MTTLKSYSFLIFLFHILIFQDLEYLKPSDGSFSKKRPKSKPWLTQSRLTRNFWSTWMQIGEIAPLFSMALVVTLFVSLVVTLGVTSLVTNWCNFGRNFCRTYECNFGRNFCRTIIVFKVVTLVVTIVVHSQAIRLHHFFTHYNPHTSMLTSALHTPLPSEAIHHPYSPSHYNPLGSFSFH